MASVSPSSLSSGMSSSTEDVASNFSTGSVGNHLGSHLHSSNNGLRTSPTNSLTSEISTTNSTTSTASAPHLMMGEASAVHCTLCAKPFRSPRLLNCLHSFCTPCLESLVQVDPQDVAGLLMAIACPECRLITKLQSFGANSGVASLPLDMSIIRLMNSSAGGGQSRSLIQCTACTGNENYAEGQCFDCGNYLCGRCVQAHQRMHCFSGHRVQPLPVPDRVPSLPHLSSKSNGAPWGNIPTCTMHPNERLELYCMSCDTAACKDCVMLLHKGQKGEHEIVGMKDVAQHHISQLNQLRDNALNEAEQLKEFSPVVLANKLQSVQNTIEDTYHFTVQLLKERRDELMQNLKAVYEEGHLGLKVVSERRRRLVHVAQYIDRLLCYCAEQEIVATKHLIQNYVDAALTSADLSSVVDGVSFTPDYRAVQSVVEKAFGVPRKHYLGEMRESNMLAGQFGMDDQTLISAVGSGRQQEPIGPPTREYRLASTSSTTSSSSMTRSSVAHSTSDNLPFTIFDDSNFPANAGAKEVDVFSLRSFHTALPSNDGRVSNRGDNAFSGVGSVGGAGDWTWNGTAASKPTGFLPSNDYRSTSETLVTDALPADVGSLAVGAPGSTSGSKMMNNIRRIKMSYVAKFGDFGTGDGQFSEPSGVAVNANKEIVVADTNNHRVQIFDSDGRFKFAFGECGKRDGQMLYPNRLAVARNGDVIVTERSPTHQIQVYNQYGVFVRKFGSEILQHPRGITVDNRGRIVVVECKVMRVIIFEPNGRVFNKFSCAQQLEFPNGVAVNNMEEIFISDNRAHCVKVFNYQGIYLRQIGGEGITNFPIGVGITERGHIVVADNHNNFNLTIFRQDGTLLSAYESRVKHAQCFDVTLLDEGSVVLASKDYKVYVYRFATAGDGSMGSYPLPSQQSLMDQPQPSPTQTPKYLMANGGPSARPLSTVNRQSMVAGPVGGFHDYYR